MLEFLTLIEHAALYLSLPVICIWSLVRGAPETKFAIWGIMFQYYVGNFLKYVFHLPDNTITMRSISFIIDIITIIIVIRGAKNVFLLIFAASVTLTWIATATTVLNRGAFFWSSMFTSEFFTWLGTSCFALALVSDDRFPNAHWRDVAKLAKFWR